jgi:hypothetical protein
MSPVQDPSRPGSAAAPEHAPTQQPGWLDPQQGVIEDARRRQHQRRMRLLIAAAIAAGLLGLGWVLIEASHANSAHAGRGGHGRPARLAFSGAPVFNVRLAPALEVGQAGWQLFFEEHGAQTGGQGNGPAISSDPIIAGGGHSVGGSHRSTTILVTTPNVVAILLNGKTRVPTIGLPGLPYGYRAVQIVTAVAPAEERIPQGLGRQPQGPSIVPLDAQGQPIHYKPNNLTPFQGKVRAWEYPARTPEGSCGLRASSLPGLTARGGKALSAVRAYPANLVGGQIEGAAFLPCVSVEYQLRGIPLQALVLLDAAAPGTRAAALPDFKAVRGSPGFFDEGGLTARREGNAWLIVEQGSSVAQRVALLRHLTALVTLGSLVPASTGVPEVGQGNAPPPPAHPAKLRVTPALEAGALGWEYIQTEAGGGGSGSCCGPLTHPAQLLGTSGSGSGPWSTATLITAPTVAAVSVEGRAPVPTRSGGLPYGMRYAALPVRNSNVRSAKASLAAFNARGQRITTAGVEPMPKRHQFEGTYAPRAWTAPSPPPAAPCELSASGLSGLSPLGGDVVPRVKGYRMFETRAFQSCTDTYYALGSSTLEAAVLLDAEHPGATPVTLPYVTRAPGAAGVFDAPGGIMRGGHSGSNNLTAERLPGAWLVVTGGSGPAQQLQLLRHLHATIHL